MFGPVTYIHSFIPNPDLTFQLLWDTIPWERREGAPRRECWMNMLNQSYTYGRGGGVRTYDPVFWHPEVVRIGSLLQHHTNQIFEGCFINGYEGLRDHLGWHADDSPEIDHERPIAVLSFGAEREIWIRDNLTGIVQKQLLGSGSLFLMHAGVQQTHQHRIPKNSAECMARISLTFRGLVKRIGDEQSGDRKIVV
jgi:alkylated DNA repair dioxygenase AlkB